MRSPIRIVLAFVVLALLAPLPAGAAIITYAEYHLGEAGSLGATNLPQDSSGNALHFGNAISGAAASVGTTGVVAPGSTAYLDTSGVGNEGWYSTNLFTGLQTDNFGFGVYARAASQGSTEGHVFTLGGNGGFAVSLAANGWAGSSHNVAWISDAGGMAGTFSPDTWVHLALIRSGGSAQFYIDGVAQGATYAGVPVHDTPHLSVHPGGTAYFDGHMDEARVVTFTAGESTAAVLNALQGVPEPSSILLLVIGGLGLLSLRRRK